MQLLCVAGEPRDKAIYLHPLCKTKAFQGDILDSEECSCFKVTFLVGSLARGETWYPGDCNVGVPGLGKGQVFEVTTYVMRETTSIHLHPVSPPPSPIQLRL